MKRFNLPTSTKVAILVAAIVCSLLWCSGGSSAQEYLAYDEAVSKVLESNSAIQYKARRWVDETNSYELWYYNGLKNLGFEKMTLRVIWRWYPEGDTSKPQQEWHMVVHLDKGQAFWLMNQIAKHFEGVSKYVEENHCPECLVRGRFEP